MALVAWPGGSWEATATLVGLAAAAYVALLWLGAVLWTYRDIRDRSQEIYFHVMAVLVVLMFFVAGLFLYLLLRPRETLAQAYSRSLQEEALLLDLEGQESCPYCRRRVGAEFLFCPYCRSQLREPCHRCRRPIRYGWALCPYCGAERRALAAAPPAPASGEKEEAAPPEPEASEAEAVTGPGLP